MESAFYARGPARHRLVPIRPLTLVRCWRRLNGTLLARDAVSKNTNTHTSTAPTVACLVRVSNTPLSLDIGVKWPSFGTLNRLEYLWPLESDFTGSLSPRFGTLQLTEVSWICCYFDEDSRVTITNKHDGGFSHTVKCLLCQGSVAQLRPTSEVIKHELLYKAELLLPKLRAVGRARASGMKASWTPVSLWIQESSCVRREGLDDRQATRESWHKQLSDAFYSIFNFWGEREWNWKVDRYSQNVVYWL